MFKKLNLVEDVLFVRNTRPSKPCPMQFILHALTEFSTNACLQLSGSASIIIWQVISIGNFRHQSHLKRKLTICRICYD